jgi:hypothetical protein
VSAVVTAGVLGLHPSGVRVVERRFPPRTDRAPIVVIELGGEDGGGLVSIPGELATLQLVVAEVVRQLVLIEEARRHDYEAAGLP